MTKLFCISDVHGFYDEMIKALNDAGFEPDNPNHLLIGLGDYIDRGRKPLEVVRYLNNLPHKVLIRGNHEDLFLDCCDRGDPYSYDVSNGTVQTINDICHNEYDYFPEACDYAKKRLSRFINSTINYFETEHYIFCHSWIPLIVKDGLPMYYLKNRKLEFNPNWRNASDEEWKDAAWGNPFDLAEKGFLPDKTIVFGHWGAYYKWQEKGKNSFNPYIGDGYIGIDGATAISGKINCLVLEDKLLCGQ